MTLQSKHIAIFEGSCKVAKHASLLIVDPASQNLQSWLALSHPKVSRSIEFSVFVRCEISHREHDWNFLIFYSTFLSLLLFLIFIFHSEIRKEYKKFKSLFIIWQDCRTSQQDRLRHDWRLTTEGKRIFNDDLIVSLNIKNSEVREFHKFPFRFCIASHLSSANQTYHFPQLNSSCLSSWKVDEFLPRWFSIVNHKRT